MHTETIIRAWKDDAFRASLTPEQQAELPVHPAGLVELDDDGLASAAGGDEGSHSTIVLTLGLCTVTVVASCYRICDPTWWPTCLTAPPV